MGTSLNVAPANNIPYYAAVNNVDAALINMTKVGKFKDELCLLDKSDDSIENICKELGWTQELHALYDEIQKKAEQKEEKKEEAKL